MTSSPELPRCDTELSLGHPAPPPCRVTGELKQKQAPATATRCCCGGRTDTELQAMAVLRVARRAAAAEEAEEGGSGLSMRRSMEWFLQRRQEARRQHGVAAESTAASPSSSSFSCLTDCSRI